MKGWRRPLISTSTMVIVIGAVFFAGKPLPSSGQILAQWTPCGCFCGFEPPHPPVPPDPVVVLNPQPCTGILSADACSRDLASLTPNQLESVCDKVKEKPNFKSFKESCPVFEKYCRTDTNQPPEDTKAKCEPPSRIPESPWLDPDVPCSNRERGVVSWKDIVGTRNQAYTVKMCGEIINYTLVNGAGGGKTGRQPGARGFDVCCESWLSALNSKSPCDVRKDIDCDGAINERDRFPDIPEDPRRPWEFFVMKAPAWPKEAGNQLDPPLNYLHAPDQSECKDCKWELIAYKFTTKKIPNRILSDATGEPQMNTEYRFKTTWKCPASGQAKENYEIVTMVPKHLYPPSAGSPPG